MSSRQQIDSVIDDDDEFCPLCIEEFDLSDKNFKPCPCGYQICQFCYNNIKTHSEEGRCPNCRRPYDDSTIQYKVPDADEFKADLALKHRKAAAAKKKEVEKREIEASSRKNLAGVRVVQKNLVYVIGLNPSIRDESQLLQTLRGREYFGQYGEIDKIVVSKAKPGGNPNQGIGVYVTYATKADAATCIAAVDGSPNGDRVLRAQYGTTKYCSSFLRNEQCHNRNCTFLHETGEDSESYSRQDLSSMNTFSTQRSGQPGGGPNGSSTPGTSAAPHVARSSAQPISQTLRRQPSKDDASSRPPDGPALPSSASWANKDAPINRARRASLTGSQPSQSPRPGNAAMATTPDELKKQQQSPALQERRQTPSPAEARASPRPSSRKAQQQQQLQLQPQQQQQQQQPQLQPQPPSDPEAPLLENLLKAVNSPQFKFIFSTSELPEEDQALIENHPSFIDPYGGVKRRAMREKAEQERVTREHELLLSAVVEDEGRESGSLQLGGEPDDLNPPTRGRTSRESHGAIQPPSQHGTNSNSAVGSPVSATSHQFQGLNLNGRSLTPLQQQQLLLLKSANNQQAGLVDPLQGAAFDQAAQVRHGLLQSQMAQFNALQQQQQNRQSSRFSFANEVNAKNLPNVRMLNQQASLLQSGSPNPLAAPSPQHSLSSTTNNNFYTSGVQGPPPGLKSAGTPPISGGGMFAQGHGFTHTNLANLGKQEPNPELMRELLRGRSGTNAGGLQSQEAAKREFMFPFLQQHQTPPPPLTPTNGLLSSFYGSQTGGYPESGPQKQKKKGKKQRHANTSSGGGGVVDLADPSILQARMHQVGANATAGQALYGSQGQVDEEFPPLGAPSAKDKHPVDSFGFLSRAQHLSQQETQGSMRTGTPTLPPGLPMPHAHPTTSTLQSPPGLSSPVPSFPPGLNPPFSRIGTPTHQARGLQSPEPKDASENAPPSNRVKDGSQISLGSPLPKSANKSRNQSKNDLAPIGDGKRDLSSASIKMKPLKLETSLDNAAQASESSPKVETSAHGQTPPLGLGSRPNTPLTNMSRTSESPAPRQPRVLRVVDNTPKTETPPPVSASQSISSNPLVPKPRSRRPSISSFSRPETPGDGGSDGEQYTSASVSRANSPPASSRIGSAPVRSMTKSQAKKERRQKAKDAEAKKQETTTVAEEPVQAPIVGRKRKTKKASAKNNAEPLSATNEHAPESMLSAKTGGSEAPTPAPAPTTTAPVPVPAPVAAATDVSATSSNIEEKPEPTKKTKSQDKVPARETKPSVVDEKSLTVEFEPAEEAWRTRNTVEQMLKDAEAGETPVKDLFSERTPPLQSLLGELHKSGALDLNKHPLFNPSNLAQRFDMKCGADDYEGLKQPIELTEEDRKTLLRGEPVRINSDSNMLKDRCLISPRGCVLHHLSPEEEERYLALEKSIAWTVDSFQEYPSVTITEPDLTNRGGGLDALFATPENFNVCWIDDAATTGLSSTAASLAGGDDLAAATTGSTGRISVTPPNVLSAMEADSTRSHNWAIANTADLVNATAASVRSFAAVTAKHMLGAAGVVMGNIPDLDDVVGMTDEELRSFAIKSQKDLEISRKDLDSIDKKLNALVKRNKKLAQQALAS